MHGRGLRETWPDSTKEISVIWIQASLVYMWHGLVQLIRYNC